MTFAKAGDGALNYYPCRYGRSRLVFRGPKRTPEPPFCAVIGGSETYGKFVETPFPDLLEARTGMMTLNLGCLNAGVDAFLGDPAALELVARARVRVVQAMGAQNMSNRFYVVHPRRNDRFLRASGMLKALYPGVDFTAFAFTGHMLDLLRRSAPDLFPVVVTELQMAWQARMRTLAERLDGPKVLLVVRGAVDQDNVLGSAPVFVTDAMEAAVAPAFDRVVRVRVPPGARGTQGMVFSELEGPAAAAMPGPAVHEEIAAALAPVVVDLAGNVG
ncbi:hypothetical protein EV656_109103 [Rhodovulum adriaticum]|uniref:DUF6473 domain-containing protein n=2 Tax=Rhodovulum adriaticum TaxID=35804 RepID=A0A4R2NK73_RHOAD|nr:DUF6473 family protein [Rhodovulum adriaticum]MBK1637098.1 hypothetical protein [Rhodovulum adriaticum]TCP21851.1 hypothetical protein EV656_109103 [Rhodovulum adriaticum]